MSGHADTIRRALPERNGWEDEFTHDAHEALDALLAENERYEKALRYYASRVTWQYGGPTDGEIAREALAGDTE